ncbi:MAG TPA: hypothetical protein VMT86_15695 [Bryobacteraceae bacterium]|nr:hypothetical protein [Bryobacteraceae bacterium]
MNLGANRKKIEYYALGGLVLIGGYLFYTNVLSNSSGSGTGAALQPAAQQRPSLRPIIGGDLSPAAGSSVSRRPAARLSEEFRPSLRPKRPEDRADPATIDPTLRLDLLSKVQAVEMQGGSRNLFQFSTAPPPPLPPEPKVKVKGGAQQLAAAHAPPPGPPMPAAPPPPPPITLKYYGYSTAAGSSKRAFFLDGDDILVATEGELVKKRYRVVRIGVNSVLVEDTQFKHEQSLPLQEDSAA